MPPGCQVVSNTQFSLLQDAVRPFQIFFFFSKMLVCLPVNADFCDGCIPHGIFKMKYSSWNILKLAILVLFYHYLMSRQLSGKIWRSFFLSQLFLAVVTVYSWKFAPLPITIKRVARFFQKWLVILDNVILRTSLLNLVCSNGNKSERIPLSH